LALAFEPQSSAAFEFVELVARAYAGLLLSPFADPDSGLNGRLFYTGEFNGEGRALVVAANIAGAASLAATADRAAQKQAIRLGVADFLVNSLDEALRILKNQLRKRETVAVCVGLAPHAVEREIEARGVLPDLLRRDVRIAPSHDAFMLQEAELEGIDFKKAHALVTWSVASDQAKWLPRLDAIALDCLDTDAWSARRWLRLSPRFLGRMAHGLRLLHCNRKFAACFIEQVRQRAGRGEIPVAVEIQWQYRGQQDVYRFVPDNSSGAS
jgi:urocanate hydratase